jgi:hypothetical protein
VRISRCSAAPPLAARNVKSRKRFFAFPAASGLEMPGRIGPMPRWPSAASGGIRGRRYAAGGPATWRRHHDASNVNSIHQQTASLTASCITLNSAGAHAAPGLPPASGAAAAALTDRCPRRATPRPPGGADSALPALRSGPHPARRLQQQPSAAAPPRRKAGLLQGRIKSMQTLARQAFAQRHCAEHGSSVFPCLSQSSLQHSSKPRLSSSSQELRLGSGEPPPQADS